MQLPSFPLISLVLILTLVIFAYQRSTKTSPAFLNLDIKGNSYQLEVAQSMLQKTKGLGERSNLCSNCGMIFVYQNEGTYPFWMKDTLIPLDMIWLNKSGNIVSIQTALPEPGASLFQLKNYVNSKPAQYIIELNAGQSAKLGLKIGDKIQLPNW